METTPPQSDVLVEYRKHLVAAEQKSQEDFDKTVLALSGGALGISFTFLKDVVGTAPVAYPYFLVASWICWGLSTFAVLLSFHLSHLALRKAIQQVDAGTIRSGKAGGRFAEFTAGLNLSGAALFLAGVIAITVFVSFNFVPKGKEDGNQTSRQSAAGAQAATGTQKLPGVHAGQTPAGADTGQPVQPEPGLHPPRPPAGAASASREEVKAP